MEIRKIILAIIASLSLLLLLAACDGPCVPPDDTPDVLCLNANAVAGDTVAVTLSHTFKAEASWIDKEQFLLPGNYKLFVNGTERAHNYIVTPGDEIAIQANSANYGSASAEVVVPKPVVDVDVTYKVSNVTVSHHDYVGDQGYYVRCNIVFTLRFKDNAPTTDFYELAFNTYYGEKGAQWASYAPVYSYLMGSTDISVEPVLGEIVPDLDTSFGIEDLEFFCFTDNKFNGQTYPLRIAFTDAVLRVNKKKGQWPGDDYDIGMEFDLRTISPSYYYWNAFEWTQNYSLMNILGEYGLAPNIPSYSNVSTGAGVVSARTSRRVKVSLKEFVDKAVKEVYQ